jgi:toxin ParE1/3/4
VRLEWSPLAMDDRERIFDFIEQDDARAAIAVDERIATQVLVLLQFPEGGRPGRVEGRANWSFAARRTSWPNGLEGLRSHPANSSQRAAVARRIDRPAVKRG